jgi:hypothetical protein
MQGILASALVALVLTLSYLAPHLSIAPASDIPSFKILFGVSILSAIISIYYLANRQEKTAVIMPLVFLLLSSAVMWVYMVSGATQAVQKTTKALIANVHPKALNNAASTTKMEEELGYNSTRGVFAKINKTTDISTMDDATSNEFFGNVLTRIAPDKFNEENSALFIRLLNNNFNGGESKLNFTIWSYVLTLPIENFNRDAQDNGAYTFMMILLILLSVSFCAGSLLLGED